MGKLGSFLVKKLEKFGAEHEKVFGFDQLLISGGEFIDFGAGEVG
jgi:hypothetical protein